MSYNTAIKVKDELTYEEFKRFMDTWQFEKGPYVEEKLVPDLYKLPVVGYVVVKSTSTGNEKETIHTYPIISSDEFSDCDHAGYDLHPDEELISVIPCSVKTFKVCGYIPNATPEEIMSDNIGFLEPVVLGYEYEGLPIPDWDQLFRETCTRWIWSKCIRSKNESAKN